MRHAVRTIAVAIALALTGPCVGAESARDLPLPRKAEPARQDNARCAAQGAGFVAVPSSQTCVKVGGYVRVDTVTAPRRP